MSEAPLPAMLFERLDAAPDSDFYREPRLVQHIDAATISALTTYYAAVLAPGAAVLDLMSSWVSHLPEGLTLARVAGLGMNAVELAANPRLGEYCVHDLNADPGLPYASASFDAVLIAVSVQYLIRPVEVFRDIARVLRPGGRVIVAMSHRCFPTKAIRAFHDSGRDERIRLVREYLHQAGGFASPTHHDVSPADADPLWVVDAARL